MISKFPEVLNFNRLFLKLNRFICNLWSVQLDMMNPSDQKFEFS